MNALPVYQQQQFEFLLLTAVERYVERLEQHCGGPTAALASLRTAPESSRVRLTSFTQAIFQDFLLDNSAGAAFVLQALPQIAFEQPTEVTTVGEALTAMALSAFRSMLRQRTEEALERDAFFEAPAVEGAR